MGLLVWRGPAGGLEKVGVCVFSCWYDGGFEKNDSVWEAVNCVIAVGKRGHLVMANMDGGYGEEGRLREGGWRWWLFGGIGSIGRNNFRWLWRVN